MLVQDSPASASPSFGELVPPKKSHLEAVVPFPWGKPVGISLLDHSPRLS